MALQNPILGNSKDIHEYKIPKSERTVSQIFLFDFSPYLDAFEFSN